ncbi:MAG: hypothetical protein H7061_03870, partial [Bdellovibrionaceae bacterium]|nr:hypothetical protein [Bdellovibrio sp.]
DYCSLPRIERTKGQFDRYLDRPMDASIYENFHLNFRTAQIHAGSVRNLASWTHQLMRVNLQTNDEAVSISTLEKTLNRLTQPGPLNKNLNLEFSDFCETWKSVVAPFISIPNQKRFEELLAELHALDIQSQNFESQNDLQATIEPTLDRTRVYLTQTELDWTAQVDHAAFVNGAMPKYPLRKGPEKLAMVELNKMVTLYNIIQLTDKAELLKHRENIRLTILDRCEGLLRWRHAA